MRIARRLRSIGPIRAHRLVASVIIAAALSIPWACARTGSTASQRHRPPPQPRQPSATASAASSTLPVSSAEPRPAHSPWTARLNAFYASYGQGPQARAAAYRGLFAPQLHRFITLESVSVDKAIQAAESFFKNKTSIEYKIVSDVSATPSSEGARVSTVVEGTWQTRLPDEWKDEIPESWMTEALLTNIARLHVDIEADADGRVVSYAERAAPPRRFRVVAKHDATRAFEVPHSQCEDGYDQLSAVQLPTGSVVESANRVLEVYGCGPGSQIFRRIVYQGQPYWVLERAYLRTDDGGSPHTGAVDYLVPVD